MSELNNREALKEYTNAHRYHDLHNIELALPLFFTPDASINVCHPFNELAGPGDYYQTFLKPLIASFEGLVRTDYIAMAGQFEGDEWASSTGYYAGHFTNDWLDIPASGTLAYLRFGEFHRMRDGKAVESYIFLDIPELMVSVGRWPIRDSPGKDRGYVGYLPGPASQDGLLWKQQDFEAGLKTFDTVVEMLLKLATKDEAWRPYWHQNMVWYGPAAFGSFIGIENFAGFQVPFENTFENWEGGTSAGSKTRHFTRFGDGNYACSGGWPSVSGTQKKRFLGQPSKGELLFMRVCDWWRRDGDQLVENWVFVDIPHVLLQMGYDVFEAKAEGA